MVSKKNNLQLWKEVFFDKYTDPDGIYKKKNHYVYNNSDHYENYANGLNKLNDNFTVSFNQDDEKPGIVIKNNNTDEYFCMKSDQFGFSAPSEKFNHVYDKYLCNQTNEKLEEAIGKVDKWIQNTRNPGGSFLWPMEIIDNKNNYDLNPAYNIRRGGSLFRRGGSYIEDRVDLTLFEVKEAIELLNNKKKKIDGNVLIEKCMTKTMRKWLLQFKSFEEYVKFFAFQPFVDEENDWMPYDILTDPHTSLTQESINKYRTKRCLYDKETINKYETIIDNVCNMIRQRNKALSPTS